MNSLPRAAGITGLAAAGLVLAAISIHPAEPRAVSPPDSAAILSAAAAFHHALAIGDSAGALGLLAPDAVILESGELETRAEYAAHHLAADIEFSRAVPSERVSTRLRQEGAVAWVASVTTSRGTFRDRPIASQGTELLVLSRTAAGWRIRAIHWSSRRLP